MKVRLELRLELDDERQFVWWASSPDVAGFYAAAPFLHELIEQAQPALAERIDGDFEIVPIVVRPDASSGDIEVPASDSRSVTLVA